MSTRPASLLLGLCSLSLGAGVGCGEEDKPPYAPHGADARPCQEIDPPPSSPLFDGQLVEESAYWDCARPQPGDGAFQVELEGTDATVTGSLAELQLSWSGGDSIADRSLLYWFEAPGRTIGLARGYYVWTPDDDSNPLDLMLRVKSEVVGGIYRLNFGIGELGEDPDAATIGNIAQHSLRVIQVGVGDVQINLNWTRLVDLDLWVTDPAGDLIIFYQKTSPSGGELDLDSYPACNFTGDRGHGNENVFWPVDAAPEGEYLVQVDLWSECGTFAQGLSTDYTVTIVLGQEDYMVYDGTFSPESSETTHEVARFTYP